MTFVITSSCKTPLVPALAVNRSIRKFVLFLGRMKIIHKFSVLECKRVRKIEAALVQHL